MPDTSRFPLDPTWVLRVAGSLELDLLGLRPEVGHALLPAIIALARAPAPAHWQRIAGSAEALARGEEVEYDYERVVTGTVTGERCPYISPIPPLYLPYISPTSPAWSRARSRASGARRGHTLALPPPAAP